MSVAPATARARLRAALPADRRLDGRTWRVRHGALVVALALHVPVLIAAAVAGTPGADPVAAAGPPTAALLLALTARRRHLQSLAVAAGLVWSSGVLVGATGGAGWTHLHVVLVVVAVSLYEYRAAVLLVAVAGVLGYGLGGWLAPAAVFGTAFAEASSVLVPLAVLLVAAGALATCTWWPTPQRDNAWLEDARARLGERERALSAELAIAEAVKEELLAVVSHEFRTPLASITGLARTLASRSDELHRDDVRACLAGIDHHARRLARVVQNVIAASGNVDVDHTAVSDLHDIAREAAEAALAAHDHRALVRLDLPPAFRAGIGTLAARRILANLCDNAVKFAPAGGVVDVTGSRRGDEVVVEVANEAPGMSERLLVHCFEPFTQADSSDTRAGEGMGLGLHVARRVARAHGGDVDARVHGDRVVFAVRLPVPGRGCPGPPDGSEPKFGEVDSTVC